MPQLSDNELERLARRRADAKLGWYVHALVYVVVNSGLIAAWYFGMRSKPWPVYPLLGWGLGLALHGVAVFLLGSGSGWREQLVQRERERLQQEREHAGRR